MSLAATSAQGTRPSQQGQESRQSSTPTNWLALAAAIIPLLIVVLALVGYGVALSAEHRFGVPHGSLFASSSDLLQLSVWGVARLITAFGSLWESPALWTLLLKAAFAGLLAGCLAAVVPILFWVMKRTQRGQCWMEAVKRQRTKLEPGARRTVVLAISGFIVFSVLSVPLAALALLTVVILIVVFLAMIPIAALYAGEAHIDDYVIGPERCGWTLTREVRLQPKAEADPSRPEEKVAQCVEVKQAAGEAVRGRVVFTTSHNMLLYIPATGEVLRVPTQGAVVRVVSEL